MTLSRILTSAVLAAMASCAMAQQYPVKPIRFVTSTQGSASDAIARILSGPVATALGQPVVVEAKPGADGAIAGAEVAKAAPDGYTLLFGSGGPIASVPSLRKHPPYNPITDFTPVVDLGRFTIFLYGHVGLPAKDFGELVAYAKANPDKLTFASGNVTGIVTFAQMNMLAGGLRMLHVPYKSEASAIADVVAGRVDLIWATPTAALAFVKAGKLRAYATQLKERSKLLPDVPTLSELGLTSFSITSFAAIYGPANMPRDVVERLNREYIAAMKRPEIIEAVEKQAFVLTPGSPESLARLTKEQVEDFGRMIRQVGIQPD